MRSESTYPHWFDGRQIDEIAFVDSLRAMNHMRCIGSVFYQEDERPLDDRLLLEMIIQRLSAVTRTGIYKKARQLLELLRIRCYQEDREPDMTVLAVANGTLDLPSRQLSEEKQFSLHRFPVAYDPAAPAPCYFQSFISSLLAPEDIPTLQEYLGYCLIPTTKAQKMMILVGRGGEGKSTLGRVIQGLWGSQVYNGSLQKVCTDRFARADLEGRLLLLDDDMRLDALPQTNYLKSLVTLEGKTDLERKGIQSYQGTLYARFLCFSNGSLSALYDRSYGFYRRQLILTTLDREEGRRDEPFLAEYMLRELPGIFNWCLEGLYRLVENEFRFTISPRTAQNLREAQQEANSAVEFLDSEGYLVYSAGACASSRALCAAYRRFCEDNSLKPQSDRAFLSYLKQNQKQLGVTYTAAIPTIKDKTVRGYVGVRVIQPPLI